MQKRTKLIIRQRLFLTQTTNLTNILSRGWYKNTFVAKNQMIQSAKKIGIDMSGVKENNYSIKALAVSNLAKQEIPKK